MNKKYFLVGDNHRTVDEKDITLARENRTQVTRNTPLTITKIDVRDYQFIKRIREGK